MLILNNDDVRAGLTMDMTIRALKQAYREVAQGEGTCRPRIDMRFPTKDRSKLFQWGTMEGGSATTGYFAIWMKSDVRFETTYQGVESHEWFCTRPGMFMGLILLLDIENGEPLAFVNDSYLQRMRVGADAAIGADLMARPDAEVVGILGSGGMARSHIAGFCAVRPVKKMQVYSPTKANRDRFAQEVRDGLGIEAVSCDTPAAAYEGAHILAACTDGGFKENPGPIPSAHLGRYLEPGAHVTSVWGALDSDTTKRIDRALLLGEAPSPLGYNLDAGMLVWAIPPENPKWSEHGYYRKLADESVNSFIAFRVAEKTVIMDELLSGKKPGRTSKEQITFSERGNLQGAQFHAVAGIVYEAAKARGLGRSLPTEWFLQDERN